MEECYRVMNTTRGEVPFMVYPAQKEEDLEGLAQHHRRRAVRSAGVWVKIPHGQSMDLVGKTGIPIKDLESNSDLNQLISAGHLMVLEKTYVEFTEDSIEEDDKIEESDIEKDVEDTVEEEDKIEEPDLERDLGNTNLPPEFSL